MAIIAKSSGGGDGVAYAPIPAGNYVARCYSMIEIGTLNEVILGNEKRVHKIRITFELPTELKVFNAEKGEQPCVISKEFTLSMNEKSNLRAFLTSWRGKAFSEEDATAFDVTKLLGVPCLLNIIHKQGRKDPSKTFDEIASATPLPKGMACPPQINPTFEFSHSEWDWEKFNSLPNFLQEKIKQSEEYIQMFAPSLVVAPAVVTPAVAAFAPAPAMKNEDAYHYSQAQQDDSDLPF
jgi:hypothetical protein